MKEGSETVGYFLNFLNADLQLTVSFFVCMYYERVWAVKVVFLQLMDHLSFWQRTALEELVQ